MRIFFCKMSEFHNVEERTDIHAVDIIGSKCSINIRTTGIRILDNKTKEEIFDKAIDI